jgi:fatty-acyl-CoA synthase
VEPNDLVGVLSWNRPEWIECMLGTFKARAAPVNLNYRYTASELEHVLADAACSVLVLERSFVDTVESIRARLPRLDTLLVIDGDYDTALAQASPARDFGSRSPHDLYVLYTGGTTGMPKGVLWRSEDLFFAALGGGAPGRTPISRPEELAAQLNPSDESALRTLTLGPLMHGAAQWVTLVTLYGGGTIVLDPARGFDADRALDIAAREQVGAIMLIGDAHARPIALAAIGRDDLASVVVFVSGGAMLSPTVKAELRGRFPHAIVLDSFGSSESGASARSTAAPAPLASRCRTAARCSIPTRSNPSPPATAGSASSHVEATSRSAT